MTSSVQMATNTFGFVWTCICTQCVWLALFKWCRHAQSCY